MTVHNETIANMAVAHEQTGRGPGAWPVAAWELRYFAAAPANWALTGAALFFFVALNAVRNTWGPVVGTSALGQLAELAYNLMLVFGVMLPFLVTDRVAHDYRQRTHELLMSSALSTRAYVWGRWLAGLAVAVGLALLMLLAQVLVNFGLRLADSAAYPAADLALTLKGWAVVALPAAISIGSLCFCLGTLWPRATALPKLGVCVAWVILAFDMDPTDLTWRAYWNPTGAGLITLLADRFQQAAQAAVSAAGLLRLQQVAPSLRPWAGPFWALAALGLLLALVSAVGFRRFRECLGS